MSAIAAALIGAAASTAGNAISNNIAYQRQKQLNQLKYDDMIKYAKMFGATPSSLISGITGSSGGVVPSVSTSNNPVSDFGSTYNNAVSADAAQKQSAAALEQSQAALTNAETERQLALMRLKFEPQKYFADIRNALSQAFRNHKEAFLHGSMAKYYDELVIDLQQVRPWKIDTLRQGLLNDMATYDKIIQETRTSRALQGYYGAATEEAQSQAMLNRATSERTYAEVFNLSLQRFRMQWENSLLQSGIDPTKSFWENTARLMQTDPDLFKQRMDMFISSLNVIDGRLQDNLGAHYKRNIGVGVGLNYLNRVHQQNANARAYRFGVIGNTISSFIPFAGGKQPQPIGFVHY